MSKPHSSEVIEHKIPHFAKLEGFLAWPDHATAPSPFALKTRIRLYTKDSLEPLRSACRAERRSLTFRDLVDAADIAPMGECVADTATGYFFMKETDDESEASMNFARIVSWGQLPTSFYIAVEGCTVGVPIVDSTPTGLPVTSKNGRAGQVLLDPDACDCVYEVRLVEAWDGTRQTLEWQYTVALSTKPGDLLRDAAGKLNFLRMAEPMCVVRKIHEIPAESVPRQVAVPVFGVIPLLAFDTRPPGPSGDRTHSPYAGEQRWSHHPALAATRAPEIEQRFNHLPADSKALRRGLNVDGDRKPNGRLQLFPRTILDISRATNPTRLMAMAHVRLGESGIVLRGATKLKRFAANGGSPVPAQIPFGEAECLSTSELSRIRTWRGTAGEVSSPIMPHYTQNVARSEQLYDPLEWISGGARSGLTFVDATLHSRELVRDRGRPTGPGTATVTRIPGGTTASIIDALEWPKDDDLLLADVTSVRHYHRDLYRRGATGGIFTSDRVNNSKLHVALDLYTFIDWRVGTVTVPGATKGEPLHALRTGHLERQDGGQTAQGAGWLFVLIARYKDQFWPVRYCHVHADPAPGHAGNDLVFRGSFLGFSGTTGNVNVGSVASKHVHMYLCSRADAQGSGGDWEDPLGLFAVAGGSQLSEATNDAAKEISGTPATGKDALKQAKLKELRALPEGAGVELNHHPWIEGIAQRLGEPLKSNEVRIVVFEAPDGAPDTATVVDPTWKVVAVTTPRNAWGAFEVYVPPDTNVRIVATRVGCAPLVRGTDWIGPVVRYRASIRFASAGEPLVIDMVD